MKIDGVAAIVTGGASGLGAATARELASAGAKVTLFDLNAEMGEQIADAIGGLVAKVDICSESSVLAGLEKSRTAHGAARILINCAGMGGVMRTVSKGRPHSLDLFSRLVEVNLIGTFNCIRLAAAEMSTLEPLEGGERGVIVNTSSVDAFDGPLLMAGYSAAKAGIVGMTLPIARDLANIGVRVCTIVPGIFKTPMLQVLPEVVLQSLNEVWTFPRRWGEAGEFARLARHICENQMLNGVSIRLDGGVRMAQH
jgi:NAD(P)-dependent dehydrogenase (short-subunit alcohol dehydrogenase family)